MTTQTKPRMPFFQLYPADFLASGKVAAMTNAEVGAYFLLMCQAWMAEPPCSVPDTDPILARWARMPLQEWLDARPSVLAAWELREGRWFQPRMEAEWGKAVAAKAAHAFGADKTNKLRKERSANAQRALSDTPSDPEASRSAHAYSEVRDQRSEETKTGMTVAAIEDETIRRRDDRQALIDTLVSCGIPAMKCITIAGNPWLTPDRLDYIIKLAVKKIPSGDRRGFIIAGIRDKYEDDPTGGKIPKVAEYKPTPTGAWV